MKQKGRPRLLNFWIVATYIVLIAVNALANLLPINGKTTVRVSNKYGDLFAPEGFTFTVGGVVYVLQALLVLYELEFS